VVGWGGGSLLKILIIRGGEDVAVALARENAVEGKRVAVKSISLQKTKQKIRRKG